jgi:hypothetical protein
LEVDHVRQIKQLRDENMRRKQLVAESTLDKTMLQDVLSPHFVAFKGTPMLRKSCKALPAPPAGRVS